MRPSRGTAFPLIVLALLAAGAAAQLTNNGAIRPKACPDVCGSCNEDGTCAYCGLGTMQVGNESSTGAVTCVKCKDPLCYSCGPTVDKCESCYPLWPISDTEAPKWPVYQDRTARCQACVNHPLFSGCEMCDALGRCEVCRSGYALTPNRACKKCKGGESCLECNPTTLQCTSCVFGTGLDAQRQCRQCAAGTSPLGEPLCDDCQADYRVCKTCLPGYYLSAQQKCLELPDNCGNANPKGQCTECWDGFFLNAAKKCVKCGDGCEKCASATACARCTEGYARSPEGKCLPCSPGCEVCKFVPPGQARCTRCFMLSLINGECRRCDDPRCADCSGNARTCRSCRNEAHVVNKATGRCEDPSWPVPCPVGTSGRRGGCTSPVQTAPRKPNASAAGRRLQGAVVKPAVIGGRNATKGRYPYMATQRVDGEDGPDQLNCGAALVHPRVLMTAAHCLLGGIDWSDEGTVFARFRIGGYEAEGGTYEVRRGKWAVVHPSVKVVNDDHLVWDIALVLLDRPSTMRPLLNLPPASPRPGAAPGTMLTAVGWGVAKDADGEYYLPAALQEATVEMIPLKQCAAYLAKEAPNESWDSQFCAGRPEKRIDTCAGDSGSPLIWKGPGGDVAVGITSWGAGCASETPGVYADVAAASNWIRDTIQWMLFEEAAGRFRGPGPI